jgi:treble-clef zinc-finger protein
LIPLAEAEIRRSFVNCSKGEAKSLSLPTGFGRVDWSEMDFFGWRDPKAPLRAYIMVEREGHLIGIALRTASPGRSQIRSAMMCDLCRTVHEAGSAGLFVAPVAGESGKQGNTVGLYLCGNLACSAYVRGTRRSSVRPQANDAVPLADRIAVMTANLNRFVDRVVSLGVPVH